jgi:hypothetical protein
MHPVLGMMMTLSFQIRCVILPSSSTHMPPDLSLVLVPGYAKIPLRERIEFGTDHSFHPAVMDGNSQAIESENIITFHPAVMDGNSQAIESENIITLNLALMQSNTQADESPKHYYS